MYKKTAQIREKIIQPLRRQRRLFTWKRLFVVLAAGSAIGFFGLTIFAAWITSDLPDPNRLQDRVITESTKMYDRTGKHLIYEVFDEKKRTVIEVTELPRYAVDATLAIEDLHFYEHKGVRWVSLMRAVVANVLRLKSGRGGASTLTQQLVKNAILTNEKTFGRKIKEAVLALQIERQFTKDQILKLYFNEIPYGSTNYGIETAAQAYFRKSAREVTVAEAATLAAIPQAPTRYLRNKDLLHARRDYILKRMRDNNFITEAQYQDAASQNTDIKNIPVSTIAPHFVMYVKDQLVEAFGEQIVDRGGLKVITTLDYDLQKAANKLVEEGVAGAEKKYNVKNGALLAMDPRNGEVVAMVGSRDFFDEKTGGQFNVTTQGVRQPGSSFKPIVYAAAFERGFPTETVLFDVETDFPYDGRSYHPKNYDFKERGPVTMRTALQGSLNIPAVKTVFLVGVDRAMDFAERLGYTTFKDRSQFGPSIVLGGGGVKMIEHARAYGVFANGGKLVQPHGVLRVEDRGGKDLTPHIEEPREVLSPDVAARITNVLSDNEAREYVFGRNNYLTVAGRQAAAKTGTTSEYHDAWIVGYVPQLVTAVWMGNNDNKPMSHNADGGRIAAPVWQQFMKEAVRSLPAEEFPLAPAIDTSNPMLRGVHGGGVVVTVDTVSGKRATPETPPETTEKRTYVPEHDILHYVNPEQPLGDAPSNPSVHAQYKAWEAGVARWVEKQKQKGETTVVFGDPPTESDDVHKKELRPVLNILYPHTGEVVSGVELVAQIEVNAPRGITRVEYRIDGKLIGSLTQYPFNLFYPISVLGAGSHVLKVAAFDDVGNTSFQEVSFQYTP